MVYILEGVVHAYIENKYQNNKDKLIPRIIMIHWTKLYRCPTAFSPANFFLLANERMERTESRLLRVYWLR